MIKNFNDQIKKSENEDLEREFHNYKKEIEFAKLKAEAKKKEILNMMLDNIKKENDKNHAEALEDRSRSHLINTRQILLMDQMEKLHNEKIKLKKIQDDNINRNKTMEKQVFKKSERLTEKKEANSVPFYERLREKTEELDKRLRQKAL